MRDFTHGNEAGHIFYFSLPMLMGNVFQQLYSTVDSIIVGNTLGKEALGAVGASFHVIFFLVSLFIGVTMGTSIIISQYFGAQDHEKIKRAMDTAYLSLFVASIFLAIVGVLASPGILRFLNTPEDILPQAVTYLRITFAGISTMVGFNATSAILRGIGDSKTPLGFLIVATVLNIILDLVFIILFGWGIAGAAWATVIAQGFSFIAGLVYLNRKHSLLRFQFRKLEFDRSVFVLSLKIGIPSGIQQMLVSAGMMALSRIVNSFGTPAVAAFAAAGRIDTFAGMPAMNLSLALSNFTGQNMGAGKPERVVRGYRAALAIASAISLCISLASVLFGRTLIGVFNSDPEVVRIGASYLAIVGMFYIIFSSMFATNGVIRGAGDTTYSMLNTILALWLVRVPVATLLSRRFGTDGIWWSMPAGWAAGFLAAYVYYRSGRWKRKTIVRGRSPSP